MNTEGRSDEEDKEDATKKSGEIDTRARSLVGDVDEEKEKKLKRALHYAVVQVRFQAIPNSRVWLFPESLSRTLSLTCFRSYNAARYARKREEKGISYRPKRLCTRFRICPTSTFVRS